MEISHHNGIDNFKKIGCFLFNIINKKYAKKMLVMLPYQKHPLHFHKKKEESFHVISGSLISNLNGKKKILKPGELHIIKIHGTSSRQEKKDVFLMRFQQLVIRMTLFIKIKK